MLFPTSILLYAAPLPPTTTDIPIDGGLIALLVGGIIFAAKKFYKNYDK